MTERNKLKGGPAPIGYEQAKTLARDPNPEVRQKLASRADMAPEILYFLAEDSDPGVRRHIAGNERTPAKAHSLLVHDADEGVRVELASRIARLAPGLTADEQDRVRRATYDVLDKLARDQVVRVRQILAEALKDVADAPPEVIRRLAHDSEIVVSGPILEFSPVLTDEDMLEIIESTTLSGALSAISRRASVSESVSEAIASSRDVSAISFLLSNPSAQIREETLDHLVELAPDILSWHEPLVTRPGLPIRAASLLAHFVADNLLRVLTNRKDLDPATAEAVSKVVRRRIDEAPPPPPPEPKEGEEESEFSWRHELIEAYNKAKKLLAAGKLDEGRLARALAEGDELFVAAAIGARAKVAPEWVMTALDAKTPKGIIALAWKADLSPTFSVEMQTSLAHLPSSKVMRPTPEGLFPMSEADMEWQIELIAEDADKDPY